MIYYPSVLTIAGSDSGGGAGIQADLKTISALGCYGTSAITTITAQNTTGVKDLHHLPTSIVIAQIEAVLSDIRPNAIKIGMISNPEVLLAVYGVLKHYQAIPIILDPVMISTSGHRLIGEDTIEPMKQFLIPLTTLVTPNLDEAAILSGMEISTVSEMKIAARKILDLNCQAVLVKGGHLKGDQLSDIYLDKNGLEFSYENTAINSLNTHGTGCTLSSAIASFLAIGFELPAAIQKAELYVHQAIKQGVDVVTGKGKGPLNHFHAPIPSIKHDTDLKN
ncbi:bifunctional hydroxymethylpyrimidine kinase/phosphomethylpyrimidine kinase [Pedobacter cryoconitis]|uniref:hydroxymethylpyrimidine kinase n=1 Tax=Pedobacter cryoconitis TaxID=188932 RepID=A0A7X0MK31_9SPHI|nr:bifunctional hydroxymethylpyrimidine kinase/phosphomethylpyrimidine kinase [Pedobacter cryoconitis]MBB6501769.1 hydroxymethylpyrimidine/phosphomethylpyrimidine kinase [Pedobacter cryoconitis]